ncbi:hypothetical protein SAMN05192533_101132 [Mesobacillus persicus]|uniref:Uncharacterized protein n=1 Tax=Mesobacillus persicus TaxID=930146 RepID=A0A1H7VV31_9BACI|nr:hypothetical protein [Mesobacillus persicus]SEM13030.1 hypothetical protein SAMN05192533_101132 [Mesobacillus persicus]
MPRKTAQVEEVAEENTNEQLDQEQAIKGETNTDEIASLNRMLGAVLTYLSDDEVEEIDIEFLLENTEGLREWWDKFRESNRKSIEEEIKQSLGELSLEELEQIREQIKEKKE